VSYSTDLLLTARRLIGGARGRPKQSDCNRAVSTAYYAVFDCLCRGVANQIVGPEPRSSEPNETWVLVYRSLDHGKADSELKKCAAAVQNETNSIKIREFAADFLALKAARHDADYNPLKKFNKKNAEGLINRADLAVQRFRSIPKDDLLKLVVALIVNTKAR
jgi:uncharacterized protein (UPF0332 family)